MDLPNFMLAVDANVCGKCSPLGCELCHCTDDEALLMTAKVDDDGQHLARRTGCKRSDRWLASLFEAGDGRIKHITENHCRRFGYDAPGDSMNEADHSRA